MQHDELETIELYPGRIEHGAESRDFFASGPSADWIVSRFDVDKGSALPWQAHHFEPGLGYPTAARPVFNIRGRNAEDALRKLADETGVRLVISRDYRWTQDPEGSDLAELPQAWYDDHLPPGFDDDDFPDIDSTRPGWRGRAQRETAAAEVASGIAFLGLW